MPMIEELWPLDWSSFHCWFSPTALFLFLNLVIGTIALTSRSVRSHRHHPTSSDDTPREELPPLPRGPSAVLERLRSFGLSRFHSGEIPLVDAPLSEADLPQAPAVQMEAKRDHKSHYGRSVSDSGEEAAGKLAGRMKKSASASSAFDHFEADEIVRRTATGRGGRHAVVAEEEEEEEEMVEVNARADDFINRFRQQLTLQRLDSIMRYKEMLNRSR